MWNTCTTTPWFKIIIFMPLKLLLNIWQLPHYNLCQDSYSHGSCTLLISKELNNWGKKKKVQSVQVTSNRNCSPPITTKILQGFYPQRDKWSVTQFPADEMHSKYLEKQESCQSQIGTGSLLELFCRWQLALIHSTKFCHRCSWATCGQ